jgi:hypothetical protein
MRVEDQRDNVRALRSALREERFRRQLAEKTARALAYELDKCREFIEELASYGGCTLEMSVAVQEFLLGSPVIAIGKKPPNQSPSR